MEPERLDALVQAGVLSLPRSSRPFCSLRSLGGRLTAGFSVISGPESARHPRCAATGGGWLVTALCCA